MNQYSLEASNKLTFTPCQKELHLHPRATPQNNMCLITRLITRASTHLSPRARIIHVPTINIKPQPRLGLEYDKFSLFLRFKLGPWFADTWFRLSSDSFRQFFLFQNQFIWVRTVLWFQDFGSNHNKFNNIEFHLFGGNPAVRLLGL